MVFSAGTSADDSEWIVYEQNTWDYLGSHSVDNSGEIYGCTDSSACNFNSNATVDNGSCTYPSDLFDCDGNCLQDLDECGTCGDGQIVMEQVYIFLNMLKAPVIINILKFIMDSDSRFIKLCLSKCN